MTTTHLTTDSSLVERSGAPGSLTRIVNVARLHLVNRSAVIWLPLFILSIIVTFSLLLRWLIGVLIERAGEGATSEVIFMGGAAGFLVIYMLVVAVQAINLTFPFAQGYSVTRHDFYLGSALAFLGLSLFWAATMSILAVIEHATAGWGLGGYLFGLEYLGVAGPATFFVYFMALLFFFFVGMAVASMYVRWKSWGLTGFFAGLALLVIGLIALATFTDSWPLVGAWLVENGAVGVAAWSIVPTLLAATTGYLILRRATPK